MLLKAKLFGSSAAASSSSSSRRRSSLFDSARIAADKLKRGRIVSQWISWHKKRDLVQGGQQEDQQDEEQQEEEQQEGGRAGGMKDESVRDESGHTIAR